jgi:hypothetical protein
MTGSSRRWGRGARSQRSSFTEELVHRGARSQRSSFTEELVHGLVDPALVSAKLLCRPVGSRAAALGRHGDAVNERRCGVRWGAQIGVRETMAFIARRLGPEKVLRDDAETRE